MPVKTRKTAPAAAPVATLSLSADKYSVRSTVKLQAVNGQPIEVIRTGTFHHPVLGRFEITEEMIDQMVDNFPGPDLLPIDYNHGSLDLNPDESMAAGWIQRVFKDTKDDRISLMAEIAWTDRAKEYIDAGEFRFVSAEMAFNDIDVETGKAVGTNLLAAALTNRPFIPGMDPVALKNRRGSVVLFVGKGGKRATFSSHSLMEELNRIISAYYATFPDSQDCYSCVVDVLTDAVIVRNESAQGTKIFKVPYTTNRQDDSISFAGIADWVEMEQTYVPVGTKVEATAANTSITAPAQVASGPQEPNKGSAKMEKILELLGLAPDASEADVTAALSALKAQADQVATLTTQNADLTAALEKVKGETAAAGASLSARDSEVVRLSERSTAFEAQNQTLKVRIEELEVVERNRQGETLIANAKASGKVAPAEVDAGADGKRPPMGGMAFSDPATFTALVDARPAAFSQYLAAQTIEGGEPEASKENKIEEFWNLVSAKRDTDPKLTQSQARAAVLVERPDLKEIF